MADVIVAPFNENVPDAIPSRRRRLTQEQKAECRRLRGVDGLSIIEIGKRVGASKSTVFTTVRDVPPPPSGLAIMSRAQIAALSWSGGNRTAHAPRPPLPDFSHLSSFQKGKLAELYFEAQCIERGIDVLKPVLDCRYDYVVIVNGRHRRIQVKWSDGRSNEKGGTITIGLTKPRGNRRSRRSPTVALYDRSEIDYVVAYLPVIKDFVVLGPDHFHQKTTISLRIDEPRNRQWQRMRFASNYLWKDGSLS